MERQSAPAPRPQQLSVRGWRSLAAILCVAIATSAIGSHLVVSLLKIKASWGAGNYRTYGQPSAKSPAGLYGSSLAYSAINWNKVSIALRVPVGRWPIPGSTPSEWEQMQKRSGDMSRSFVVFSIVDLNEYSLCDFRAEIVPLGQTLTDLWPLEADRRYVKRVLSQYPISALRVLFPTVGRSDGVMTGIRDEARRILGGAAQRDGGEAFSFPPDTALAPEEKVTDWAPGRFERRMALMRAACDGKHAFDRLKMAALTRLLQRTRAKGSVTVVVLPASPYYQREFVDERVRRDFERALGSLRAGSPDTTWIRLDQVPELQNNALFADFVHENRNGQEISTRVFMEQLGIELARP